MISVTTLANIVALLSLLSNIATATHAVSQTSLTRRDNPPILSPAGPYIFTEGLAGCSNGSGGSFSYDWTLDGTRNATTNYCGKGWQKGTDGIISYVGNYFSNGYSKFSINGWTRSPLVEYIIMESWGSSIRPSSGGILKGRVTCNGRTYDIISNTLVNQPSIDGVQTYLQYWSAAINSIRGTIKGEVDLKCHFKAWEAAGMKLGASHEYQIASIDAVFSAGNFSLTIGH